MQYPYGKRQSVAAQKLKVALSPAPFYCRMSFSHTALQNSQNYFPKSGRIIFMCPRFLPIIFPFTCHHRNAFAEYSCESVDQVSARGKVQLLLK
jgi:hypothetical protein